MSNEFVVVDRLLVVLFKGEIVDGSYHVFTDKGVEEFETKDDVLAGTGGIALQMSLFPSDIPRQLPLLRRANNK